MNNIQVESLHPVKGKGGTFDISQQSPDRTHILVVDDEEPIRNLVKRAVDQAGFQCLTASNGKEALAMLKQDRMDVVITDIMMPELDGIRLTQEVRNIYMADVIVMTGYVEGYTYNEIITEGASDFIQKPLDLKELILRLRRVLKERDIIAARDKAEAQLKESFDKMLRVLGEIVSSLGSALEMRDPYTAGHQKKVTELACAISSEMGLSEDQIDGIRIAGLLHDIGKISVPTSILNKSGHLNEHEFNLIKMHPQTGFDIVKDIEFDQPVAQIILQHHERLDGSGYPQGLSGEEILLESRILAVADVVEAMSSHRPYRPALGIEKALEVIEKGKSVHYDARVVDVCVKLFAENKFEFEK
jgi:putative two-component system response regulator